MNGLSQHRVYGNRFQKGRFSRRVGACDQHSPFHMNAVFYRILQKRMVQVCNLQFFSFFRNAPFFQIFPVGSDCNSGFHFSRDGQHPVNVILMNPNLFQHTVKADDIKMKNHIDIIRKNFQRISAVSRGAHSPGSALFQSGKAF